MEHHHLFLKKVGIARQSEADVFKHLTLPAFVEKIEVGQRHIAHIRRLHKFDDDMMVSGTDNRFRTDKKMRGKGKGEIVLAPALDIISPRRASDEENHIFQQFVLPVDRLAFLKMHEFQAFDEFRLFFCRKVHFVAQVVEKRQLVAVDNVIFCH